MRTSVGRLARGVLESEGGWRLAMDNKAYAVGSFDFAALVGATRCPVHLACGEHDHMVTLERLRDFEPAACLIEGASHNAMVDRPDAVWGWLNSFQTTATGA